MPGPRSNSPRRTHYCTFEGSAHITHWGCGAWPLHSDPCSASLFTRLAASQPVRDPGSRTLRVKTSTTLHITRKPFGLGPAGLRQDQIGQPIAHQGRGPQICLGLVLILHFKSAPNAPIKLRGDQSHGTNPPGGNDGLERFAARCALGILRIHEPGGEVFT